MIKKRLYQKNRKRGHDPLYCFCRQGKKLVETIVLYVLYAGIYQLYYLDTDVREEIAGWRLGQVYTLQCSKNGPNLCMMKTRNGICRIARKSYRLADVVFQFKSLDQAFFVMTGQISVAQAYARHAFTLFGDISAGMSFSRVVDRTELYLFPKIITRRILKKQNKRQVPMLYVYFRIAAGILKGSYKVQL